MRNLIFFLLIFGMNLYSTSSEYSDEFFEYKQQTRIGKCSNVSLDDIVSVYRVDKWALPFLERSDRVSIKIMSSSFFALHAYHT